MDTTSNVRHVRTLFLSDVHLGSKAAKADCFLDFLRVHDADTIILVGDIIDGWRLKKRWYWPQEYNDVIQKHLRKARKGTRIVYIPGNHDEFLRNFPGTHFGGIEVAQDIVHRAADGRRYLVLHGDEFDVVVRNARLLAHLGDWGYDLAIAVNVVLNAVRRRIGMPYWSFSAWAKLRVKRAVNFIGEFKRVVAKEARRRDVADMKGAAAQGLMFCLVNAGLGLAILTSGFLYSRFGADWFFAMAGARSCGAPAGTSRFGHTAVRSVAGSRQTRRA